ncbi:MAG: putative toxin-antitoxin system toxin component, PIN family [Trichlorobacter sp.]|nr:putative toxin-antitoxin system toxin component, PIN family [Trichlorobacter sp.]
MNIVVDTNLFVGACLGQGACRSVIIACLEEKLTPLMGMALLSEYEDLLGRAWLFNKSRLNEEERSELLDIFLSVCRWVKIYYGWRPNLKDEADNHLVELAIAGGAEYIVTRNIRDLAGMDLVFPDLRIITPEAFCKELVL